MANANALEDRIFSDFEQKIKEINEQTVLDQDFSVEGESIFLRAKGIDKNYSPCLVFSRNLHEIDKNPGFGLPRAAEYSITVIDHFKKNTLSDLIPNEIDVFVSMHGRVLLTKSRQILNKYALPINGMTYKKAADMMITNFQQAVYKTKQRLGAMKVKAVD